MSLIPALHGIGPSRPFQKPLLGLYIVSEAVKIPLSFLIFNEKWTKHGPLWRCGVLTAFTKHMLRTFKWELVVVSAIYLPQIVQGVNFVYKSFVSFKRRNTRRKGRNLYNHMPNCGEDGFYHYQPLNASDKEIRLLKLYPGSGDEKIHVEAFLTSLYDNPRFLALSYVWGNTWSEEPIVINGKQFNVTTNLYEALKHLRNIKGHDAGIPFWIDALCIDQVNDTERGEQVRLMKEIYSSAFKVLVWLGVPSQDSELAMAKMTGLEAYFYLCLRDTTDEEKNEDIQPQDNVSHYHEILAGPLSPPEHLEAWEAVVRFLERPWWNRAWIAQEVSSPVSRLTPLGNVEIIMGRELQTVSFLSTVRLLALVFSLYRSTNVPEYGPRTRDSAVMEKGSNLSFGIDRLAHISSLRNKQKTITQQIVTILSGSWRNSVVKAKAEQYLWTTQVRPMLTLFRGLGCGNPRDKIYAALPLILPDSHPAISPNYTLPIDEIFVQVVRSFIKYENCLSILACCSGENKELPSWVPDWRRGIETNELCTRIDTHGNPVYHASGNTLPSCAISTEVFTPKVDKVNSETDQNLSRWILAANGIIVDAITEVSSISLHTKDIHQPEWEAIVQGLPHHYAPTNEPVHHAYQRLLMTDIYDKKPFYGDEKDATWRQRLLTGFEVLESWIRKWISQAHKHLPSYSVLNAYESIGVPRRHLAWKRGVTVEENFFDQTPADVDVVHWSSPTLSAEEKKEAIRKYDDGRRVQKLVQLAITNRVLCITEKGYIGLVPYKARAGDQIVVLFGGLTPFLVREVEVVRGEKRWSLLGECYVHGLMDGEAMRGLDSEEMEKAQKFVLI